MRRCLRLRSLAVAALAVLAAVVLAGCGLGAGKRSTGARVLVTRDFGTRVAGAKIASDVPSSDTVMRLLQRNFSVQTRYGGGFVQAIDGLAGGTDNGRKVDWFFYVNGILSDKGAADVQVHGGDSIWWDRHEWTVGAQQQALVGAFPEPFLHGFNGKRWPVALECGPDADKACAAVTSRLSGAGVVAPRQTIGTSVGQDMMRVLVGPWRDLRGDPALGQIDRGPAVSGVYAQFDKSGATLSLLDPAGKPAKTLGAGAGLVAATRFEQQAPTWAITGTDEAGVLAAAQALDPQRLRNRFALAVQGTADTGVPIPR